MRILLISAFYPPQVIGGWEQLVQDIVARLQARGHTTHVLTSTFGLEEHGLEEPGIEEPGVSRRLVLESDLLHYSPQDALLNGRRRAAGNLDVTREVIGRFEPDVVFIHGMWNLSHGVAWQAEQLCPGRVVYYVANDWPYAPDSHTLYWRDPARSGGRRWFKQLLAPLALRAAQWALPAFPLRFEHVLCVSQAMLQDLQQCAGIPAENLRVVYNGVEVNRFTPAQHPAEGHDLALLYAGSLAPHKGVHTAIQAMGLLAQRELPQQVTLTLVGSGHPEYETYLHELVREHGVSESVSFLPRVEREEMPALLRRFDGLVFPSTWEEPLSRGMQEAMASGLVVVGTLTGGTPEILVDGETGLAFAPQDAAGLAGCLERLSRDPALRQRLAANARRLVEQKFDLERMLDEIEAYLSEVAGV